MKRIFALLLLIACVFSIVSCNKTTDEDNTPADIKLFTDMLATSAPTKSVVTVTQSLGKTNFVSTYTLTTGKVGDADASILSSNVQQLIDLAETKYSYIESKKSETWYLEGKGISVNGGKKWDETGTNFAPVAGSLKLDLSEGNYTSYEYDAEKSTIEFEIPWEKTEAVLANYLYEGQYYEYDTKLTLVAAGGRIVKIVIKYSIPEESIGDFENSVDVGEIDVVIEATYSYGLQEISMG